MSSPSPCHHRSALGRSIHRILALLALAIVVTAAIPACGSGASTPADQKAARYNANLAAAVAALAENDAVKAERAAFALTLLDESRCEGHAALAAALALQKKQPESKAEFDLAESNAGGSGKRLVELLAYSTAAEPMSVDPAATQRSTGEKWQSTLADAIAALLADDAVKAERLAYAVTQLDDSRCEVDAVLALALVKQSKQSEAKAAFDAAKTKARGSDVGMVELLVAVVSPTPTPTLAPPKPADAKITLEWCDVVAADPDPAVVTDAAARARMTATKLPWKVRDRKTGIVMLLCPPGEFMMGSSGQERRQAPQYVPAEKQSDYERWITNEFPHDVVISRPFYLAETELTQAQWLRIARELHSSADEMNGPDAALLPVEQVSWDSCQRFCELSGLRLPSEAEWEYACRAGTSSTFSFGAGIDTDQVNYDGDYPYGGARAGKDRGRAVACGGLPANPWGFHEMHGNVWEWCQDCYKAMPPLNQEPQTDDASDQRVVRGGGWRCLATDCRSAARAALAPSVASVNIGVRLARNSE